MADILDWAKAIIVVVVVVAIAYFWSIRNKLLGMLMGSAVGQLKSLGKQTTKAFKKLGEDIGKVDLKPIGDVFKQVTCCKKILGRRVCSKWPSSCPPGYTRK